MEEMIFNLADTHLFFNDLEVSSDYFVYTLPGACLKIDEWSENTNEILLFRECITRIMR